MWNAAVWQSQAGIVYSYPSSLRNWRLLLNWQPDLYSIYLMCSPRNGVELVLNAKVQAVSRDCVTVVDKAGAATDIPFGACVWATGVAMHPFMRHLQEQLPEQAHFRWPGFPRPSFHLALVYSFAAA